MTANKREMKKIGNWLVDGDTGLSSCSMAAVALGGSPSYVWAPADPNDFRRCVDFLVNCIDPSHATSLLLQMAHFTAQWHRIAANWFQLVELYNEEKKAGKSTKALALMKSLGL